MKGKNENIGCQEIRGLNENHERTISATLSLIEKDLILIEMYIKSTPCGRMYKVINKLTPAEERQVLSIIKELKDCIREFADFFNLQPLEENISGIIQGNSAIYWANLCDMEPRKLKKYGQVGTDVTDALSHFIERLKKLLNAF